MQTDHITIDAPPVLEDSIITDNHPSFCPPEDSVSKAKADPTEKEEATDQTARSKNINLLGIVGGAVQLEPSQSAQRRKEESTAGRHIEITDQKAGMLSFADDSKEALPSVQTEASRNQQILLSKKLHSYANASLQVGDFKKSYRPLARKPCEPRRIKQVISVGGGGVTGGALSRQQMSTAFETVKIQNIPSKIRKIREAHFQKETQQVLSVRPVQRNVATQGGTRSKSIQSQPLQKRPATQGKHITDALQVFSKSKLETSKQSRAAESVVSGLRQKRKTLQNDMFKKDPVALRNEIFKQDTGDKVEEIKQILDKHTPNMSGDPQPSYFNTEERSSGTYNFSNSHKLATIDTIHRGVPQGYNQDLSNLWHVQQKEEAIPTPEGQKPKDEALTQFKLIPALMDNNTEKKHEHANTLLMSPNDTQTNSQHEQQPSFLFGWQKNAQEFIEQNIIPPPLESHPTHTDHIETLAQNSRLIETLNEIPDSKKTIQPIPVPNQVPQAPPGDKKAIVIPTAADQARPNTQQVNKQPLRIDFQIDPQRLGSQEEKKRETKRSRVSKKRLIRSNLKDVASRLPPSQPLSQVFPMKMAHEESDNDPIKIKSYQPIKPAKPEPFFSLPNFDLNPKAQQKYQKIDTKAFRSKSTRGGVRSQGRPLKKARTNKPLARAEDPLRIRENTFHDTPVTKPPLENEQLQMEALKGQNSVQPLNRGLGSNQLNSIFNASNEHLDNLLNGRRYTTAVNTQLQQSDGDDIKYESIFPNRILLTKDNVIDDNITGSVTASAFKDSIQDKNMELLKRLQQSDFKSEDIHQDSLQQQARTSDHAVKVVDTDLPPEAVIYSNRTPNIKNQLVQEAKPEGDLSSGNLAVSQSQRLHKALIHTGNSNPNLVSKYPKGNSKETFIPPVPIPAKQEKQLVYFASKIDKGGSNVSQTYMSQDSAYMALNRGSNTGSFLHKSYLSPLNRQIYDSANQTNTSKQPEKDYNEQPQNIQITLCNQIVKSKREDCRQETLMQSLQSRQESTDRPILSFKGDKQMFNIRTPGGGVISLAQAKKRLTKKSKSRSKTPKSVHDETFKFLENFESKKDAYLQNYYESQKRIQMRNHFLMLRQKALNKQQEQSKQVFVHNVALASHAQTQDARHSIVTINNYEEMSKLQKTLKLDQTYRSQGGFATQPSLAPRKQSIKQQKIQSIQNVFEKLQNNNLILESQRNSATSDEQTPNTTYQGQRPTRSRISNPSRKSRLSDKNLHLSHRSTGLGDQVEKPKHKSMRVEKVSIIGLNLGESSQFYQPPGALHLIPSIDPQTSQSATNKDLFNPHHDTLGQVFIEQTPSEENMPPTELSGEKRDSKSSKQGFVNQPALIVIDQNFNILENKTAKALSLNQLQQQQPTNKGTSDYFESSQQPTKTDHQIETHRTGNHTESAGSSINGEANLTGMRNAPGVFSRNEANYKETEMKADPSIQATSKTLTGKQGSRQNRSLSIEKKSVLKNDSDSSQIRKVLRNDQIGSGDEIKIRHIQLQKFPKHLVDNQNSHRQIQDYDSNETAKLDLNFKSDPNHLKTMEAPPAAPPQRVNISEIAQRKSNNSVEIGSGSQPIRVPNPFTLESRDPQPIQTSLMKNHPQSPDGGSSRGAKEAPYKLLTRPNDSGEVKVLKREFESFSNNTRTRRDFQVTQSTRIQNNSSKNLQMRLSPKNNSSYINKLTMVGKSGETSATRHQVQQNPPSADKSEKKLGVSKANLKGLEHTFDSNAQIKTEMDKNAQYQKELQKKILLLKGHQLVSTHVYEFPEEDPANNDLKKRRAFSQNIYKRFFLGGEKGRLQINTPRRKAADAAEKAFRLNKDKNYVKSREGNLILIPDITEKPKSKKGSPKKESPKRSKSRKSNASRSNSPSRVYANSSRISGRQANGSPQLNDYFGSNNFEVLMISGNAAAAAFPQLLYSQDLSQVEPAPKPIEQQPQNPVLEGFTQLSDLFSQHIPNSAQQTSPDGGQPGFQIGEMTNKEQPQVPSFIHIQTLNLPMWSEQSRVLSNEAGPQNAAYQSNRDKSHRSKESTHGSRMSARSAKSTLRPEGTTQTPSHYTIKQMPEGRAVKPSELRKQLQKSKNKERLSKLSGNNSWVVQNFKPVAKPPTRIQRKINAGSVPKVPLQIDTAAPENDYRASALHSFGPKREPSGATSAGSRGSKFKAVRSRDSKMLESPTFVDANNYSPLGRNLVTQIQQRQRAIENKTPMVVPNKLAYHQGLTQKETNRAWTQNINMPMCGGFRAKRSSQGRRPGDSREGSRMKSQLSQNSNRSQANQSKPSNQTSMVQSPKQKQVPINQQELMLIQNYGSSFDAQKPSSADGNISYKRPQRLVKAGGFTQGLLTKIGKSPKTVGLTVDMNSFIKQMGEQDASKGIPLHVKAPRPVISPISKNSTIINGQHQPDNSPGMRPLNTFERSLEGKNPNVILSLRGQDIEGFKETFEMADQLDFMNNLDEFTRLNGMLDHIKRSTASNQEYSSPKSKSEKDPLTSQRRKEEMQKHMTELFILDNQEPLLATKGSPQTVESITAMQKVEGPPTKQKSSRVQYSNQFIPIQRITAIKIPPSQPTDSIVEHKDSQPAVTTVDYEDTPYPVLQHGSAVTPILGRPTPYSQARQSDTAQLTDTPSKSYSQRVPMDLNQTVSAGPPSNYVPSLNLGKVMNSMNSKQHRQVYSLNEEGSVKANNNPVFSTDNQLDTQVQGVEMDSDRQEGDGKMTAKLTESIEKLNVDKEARSNKTTRE